MEFQKRTKRYKKAFFNEQCLIIEENNKRGKTRNLVSKVGNIKEAFCPKIGTIKDENDRDPVDTKETKKRWKEYTELYKILMNQITVMVWLVTQSQTF